MTYSRFRRCLLLCVFSVSAATSAYAQLPGAIFTTLSDGTRVNANIYPAKCGVSPSGVWLDGGPGTNAPQGAAGLPDGDYYFQVTDPSGKVLLSTDAVIRRQFHVSGGIITGLSGLGNHNTGFDVDHGATTIELCPFLDTPNPGGVYKAWITPIGKFDGDPSKVDNDCGHGCFHGFVPAFSKTDNFKVRGGPSLPCLVVFKFIDGNGDGSFAGDTFVSWPITITDPLGSSNTKYTSATSKECLFSQLPTGAYVVVEGSDLNFIVTANILDGVSSNHPDTTVVVRMRSSSRELIFGNARK